MSANATFLYPNVTSLPKTGGADQAEKANRKAEGTKSEFDQIFDRMGDQGLGEAKVGSAAEVPDLGKVKEPLKFSAHAAQRLSDRKIKIDAATMMKINDAVDRASAKGIEDSLILTNDAALIVSVKNRTVITAMDRGSLAGNVFTNIDGAVII